MQKITPYLWFEGQAGEAANHYVSTFKNSRIISTNHYGENMPMPAGTVLTVTFELDGERFVALNGGPEFKFSEAISFFVTCHDQAEVDYFWERLGEGGEPGPCGWLKDRYGVSWQIVPTALEQLTSDPDQEKAGRVWQAMFGMTKIDIQGLRNAYEGRA